MNENKKYFTTKELAHYLSFSPATLIGYRVEGVGPKYVKIGRMIRYRIEDVEAWILKENKKNKTAGL